MAMMWNRKVFIRIIEVLLCIACVVALRVTDDESRRVFHYLRNRSREWSILNNVTWGTIGAALATATCGGYIIITTGLLIAAITGELTGRMTELFLLGLGVILFGIVGSLSLASIESVPDDLIDNAAVLGGLCLLTCLAFIADLLMSTPRRSKKNEGAQGAFVDKEAAVKKMTAMSLENETKARGDDEEVEGSLQAPRTTGKTNGRVNEIFDDSDEVARRSRVGQVEPEVSRTTDGDDENFAKVTRPRRTEVRENQLRQDERQSREYAEQNFENVRTLRDARASGEADRGRERNSLGKKDYYDKDNHFNDRSIDEIETPLFPTTRDNRAEPMFAKIVNPSVKVMRVERDLEENYDTRNSDSSQYDNVPTRMFGNSNGNFKKNRDVSFNVRSSRSYASQNGGRNQDDIEMLEEWINVLKTTTGTQTGPSSPTDPGYVRHTANNWPRDFGSKTSGSSQQTRRE